MQSVLELATRWQCQLVEQSIDVQDWGGGLESVLGYADWCGIERMHATGLIINGFNI